MLGKKDIEEAKKLFKEWDNESIWKIPSPAFIEHSKKKADDSLDLAAYLLEKLEKTKELSENSAVTLWIVTQSYYSMFFRIEYLLALDNKQIPEGSKDTHKTIYLAFLYYYIIKGSELEKNTFNKTEITTSRMSRALSIFKESQDEALELQRIEKSAKNLKNEREKRNAFTYRMNRSAEIEEARSSLEKAREFRNLTEEFILSRINK